MAINGPYPPIEYTPAEMVRQEELVKLGREFAREMRDVGNRYALKGGTALVLTVGLPRPSMDLDFEGETAIRQRQVVKRALKRAFPGKRYRVGFDWLRIGKLEITRPRRLWGPRETMDLDYRYTGAADNNPVVVPIEACTDYKGITTYKPEPLVHKKLETLVGSSPRELPRDIYDAGWLVTHRPELVGTANEEKLKIWINSKTPGQVKRYSFTASSPSVDGPR